MKQEYDFPQIPLKFARVQLDTTFSSSTGFTFEAWVYKTPEDNEENSVVKNLFSIGSDTISLSVKIDTTNATTLALTWGATFSQTDQSTNLMDGRWHHIAVVVKEPNIVFYIDGANIGSSQFDDTQTASGSLILGSSFNGYITQVAVWQVALSESELLLWMNSTFPGSKTDLVGYWTFDKGKSSTNLISGRTIELDGDATITANDNNLDYYINQNYIPYGIFLYPFNADSFVTVTAEGFGTAQNKIIQTAIQSEIAKYIDSAFLLSSGSDQNRLLFPSLVNFTTLYDTLLDASANQLLLPMAIAKHLPPSSYSFDGTPISLPKSSNNELALWDYTVLNDLVTPQLAANLGISASDLQIVYNNCSPVLKLTQPVNINSADVDSLTVEIVSAGFQIKVGGTAVANLYRFSVATTVAISIDAETQMLTVTPKNKSANIGLTTTGSLAFYGVELFLLVVMTIATLGEAFILAIILFILFLLFAIFMLFIVQIVFNNAVDRLLDIITMERPLSFPLQYKLKQVSFKENAIEFYGNLPDTSACDSND